MHVIVHPRALDGRRRGGRVDHGAVQPLDGQRERLRCGVLVAVFGVGTLPRAGRAGSAAFVLRGHVILVRALLPSLRDLPDALDLEPLPHEVGVAAMGLDEGDVVVVGHELVIRVARSREGKLPFLSLIPLSHLASSCGRFVPKWLRAPPPPEIQRRWSILEAPSSLDAAKTPIAVGPWRVDATCPFPRASSPTRSFNCAGRTSTRRVSARVRSPMGGSATTAAARRRRPPSLRPTSRRPIFRHLRTASLKRSIRSVRSPSMPRHARGTRGMEM